MINLEETMTFQSAKDIYTHLREDERIKIVNYLISNGYDVVSGSKAGKGIKNYTSGKRMHPPYDLSNWKYIEAYKDNFLFFISLQAFDVDPISNNHHILMDRLGIYKYPGCDLEDRKKNYFAYDALTKMTVTDIELPMNDYKLKRLLECLNICSSNIQHINSLEENKNENCPH